MHCRSGKRLFWTLAGILIAVGVSAAELDGPWPSFYRGMARRAYQDVDTPAAPTSIKWQVEVPHGVSQGGISIGTNNRIYFKTNGGADGSYVFCLDKTDGQVIWQSPKLGGNAGNYAGVEVAQDAIYYANNTGPAAVYRANPDTGAVVWEKQIGTSPRATPVCGTVNNPRGRPNVYVWLREDMQVVALDSLTGDEMWRYAGQIPTSFGNIGPVTVMDGKQVLFLFPNAASQGVALRDDGNSYTLLWSGGAPRNFNWLGNGTLSNDGSRIYVPTFWDGDNPSMHAIDPMTGAEIWSLRVGNHFGRASMNANGRIYVGGHQLSDQNPGGSLTAYVDLGECGDYAWQLQGIGSPAGDEITAVASINGYIYCFSNSGWMAVVADRGDSPEIIWESAAAIGSNSFGNMAPAIDTDGTVFVGSNLRDATNQKVYAFAPTEPPTTGEDAGSITTVERQDGNVRLAWEESSSRKYEVQAGAAPGGPFESIAMVDGAETYTVAAPADAAMFYQILYKDLAPPAEDYVDVFFDDFEAPIAGWTHSGAGDNWTLGTPVDYANDDSAPQGAYSGINAWGTGIAGPYLANADCTLQSPIIDLTGYFGARASWRMFVNTEAFVDTYGIVVVNVDDPGNTLVVVNPADSSRQDVKCWGRGAADISLMAGKRVRIQFILRSDDSVEFSGFYIDDLLVEATTAFTPTPDNVAKDGIVAFNPDGSVKWVYEAPGGDSWWQRTGYAMSPDHATIYATHRGYQAGGGIWAVNTADGSVKWHWNSLDDPFSSDPFNGSNPGDGDFFSTPVVGADGTVYSVDVNGTVTALRDDGTQGAIIWDVHQPDGQAAWNYAEGAIGTDGSVMFVSDSGGANNVFLFQALSSATPGQPWLSYQGSNANLGFATGGGQATSTYAATLIAGGLWSHPTQAPNGTWIIATNDAAPRQVTALDANLQVVWTRALSDWSDGGAAIAPDGTIYVGSNGGDVRSFAADGTPGWNVTVGGAVNSRLKLHGGTLYGSAGNNTIFALNAADGSLKWSVAGGDDTWNNAPAVSNDGSVVYYRSKASGRLTAFNATDGSTLWDRRVGTNWDGLTPMIGPDGTIYVGSTNVVDPFDI